MPKISKSARVTKPKRRNERNILAAQRAQEPRNYGGRPPKHRGRGRGKLGQNVSTPMVTQSYNTSSPDHSNECQAGSSEEASLVENMCNSGSESSVLSLHLFEISTSKVDSSIKKETSRIDTFDECSAGPSLQALCVENDITSDSEPPLLTSQQWETQQTASPHLKIIRMENVAMSDFETPSLKLLQRGTSTPKVTVTVGTVSSPNDPLEECVAATEAIGGVLNSVGCSIHGVSEDLLGVLSDQLRRRLPNEWSFRFHQGRIKVELMLPNPLRSGVQRAVNVACDGSDLLVQVHMETLPETNEVYSHPLMKPLVTLSSETVKEFSDVVCGAVFAVQMHNICIGVGVDFLECVDEWQEHPDCFLDTNKFEQLEYDRTLRTKTCSYLVSRRSKRCAHCNHYREVLRKREVRRNPEGGVHPNTRHDILTSKRLKQKLQDKERKIRTQEAALVRMRERMNKILGEEAVPVMTSSPAN